MPGLRVAQVGGVPQALGGGGLELQMRETAAALRGIGHDVRAAHELEPGAGVDVLHVFGHGSDVGHVLAHWRRAPARLVVSPVVVVPPRRERRLRMATRLPIPAFEPRVLRDLVRRADALVALTAWERDLLRRVGGSASAPCWVVGNGVAPVEGGDRDLPDLPTRYALAVGTVTRRKRQVEVARAFAGELPLVVVGGVEDDALRGALEDALAEGGGVWLGELDNATTRAITTRASVLVHLSDAEGESLAVLEAIGAGVPAVVSALPQNRELARRFGDHVVVCEDDRAAVEAARRAVDAAPRTPAPVPTWTDVAKELAAVLAWTLEQREARTWADR